jgi:hypothetical protein
LLFGHGLPLPGYDAEALKVLEGDSFTAEFREALRQPTTAALAMFGIQNSADATQGEATEMVERTVTCRFHDGSGVVQIIMRPVEGTPYWMPTGWASANPVGK